MKVIDLLNKIAEEEIKDIPNFDNLPAKIKYENVEYSLIATYENNRNYLCYAEDNLSEDAWGEFGIDTYSLNDEIEILEESKGE